MKVRKLQSRTARGVKIGDHESQIVARLGKPNKIERSADQTRILRYENGRSRDEAYKFRAGRLVEIQFRPNRDEEDED